MATICTYGTALFTIGLPFLLHVLLCVSFSDVLMLLTMDMVPILTLMVMMGVMQVMGAIYLSTGKS